ncbi:hypothetical protein Taro_037332 [Colocasia esculenta]|uniref:Peroxidase n=1 Tax=Colocasia esculenta TaxID=4460 RepID=A0A843W3X4_COLES|nr:hypothetical protein [Colocasia esculenta]
MPAAGLPSGGVSRTLYVLPTGHLASLLENPPPSTFLFMSSAGATLPPAIKMRPSDVVASFLLLLASIAAAHGALQAGFYKGKCDSHDVEALIQSVVRSQFRRDPTLAPALMRMQFHDCFVRVRNIVINAETPASRPPFIPPGSACFGNLVLFSLLTIYGCMSGLPQGCDASILLDGNSSEKTAGPNQSVRGYGFIDQVKTVLESLCPGVVSCADIIVAATRDVIAMVGGPKYAVQMGRRDGRISRSGDVNLPGPSISVAQASVVFRGKGLMTSDMVVLLGGHTIGVTHCSFVTGRIYNFQGSGSADPTMDPALVSQLQSRCPQNAAVDATVNLDQNPRSANVVDNSFYQQIARKRGILQIDQSLALHRTTRQTVALLANGTGFPAQFGAAMVKLGNIQVLTGRQGEIRESCRSVN